jgi:GTP cyclohydrolase I
MSREADRVVEKLARHEALASVPPEDRDRVETIAGYVCGILKELDIDVTDPNMVDTDLRVAKMYLEMFHGLREGAEPKVTTFPNAEGYEHMVMERDIPFYSMCEHHLVPFHGAAHVAYLPKGNLTGLSKLARLVEAYARRPQLQERLTSQIADTLMDVVQPYGVLVVVEAEHLCMSMRGVKKPGAITVTSAVRGTLASDPAARAEALSLLHGGPPGVFAGGNSRPLRRS